MAQPMFWTTTVGVMATGLFPVLCYLFISRQWWPPTWQILVEQSSVNEVSPVALPVPAPVPAAVIPLAGLRNKPGTSASA